MSIFDKFRKKKTVEPKKSEKKVVKKAKKADLTEPKLVPQKKSQPKSKARMAQIYNILKEPHITEKATDLADSPDRGKYVFKVNLKASKIEIKKAVEDLYNVKAIKVNIVKMPAKKRRLGRFEGYKLGQKRGFKKAIVTLAPGEKIEIMPK